jgi:hypothetical protein
MQLREGSFHRPRPACPEHPKQRVHRHGFYLRFENCDGQQPLSVFSKVPAGWLGDCKGARDETPFSKQCRSLATANFDTIITDIAIFYSDDEKPFNEVDACLPKNSASAALASETHPASPRSRRLAKSNSQYLWI